MTRAAALLGAAEATFRGAEIPTPRLDAEVLLAATLGVTRAGLYARLQDVVAPPVEARYHAAVERRRRREPVAYITEAKEFCSLAFAVTPAVLVPRPETEHVVEAAREILREQPAALVCDVGTGSGCIAVALASALPQVRVVAVDASAAALRVGYANARAHGVLDRVRFVAGDILSPFAMGTRFDLILSNPPYLKSTDLLSPDVDWEPRIALAAGGDGLAVIRQLVQVAPAYLRSQGTLVMEFGDGQEAAVHDLACLAGFRAVRIARDLAGLPRVLVASGCAPSAFGNQRRATGEAPAAAR